MDPYTGALLAVANVPNYDVRSFQRFTPDQRRDRAVTDAYEPGSTFKLITATAALESHKVTTASMFPARDAIEVGGSVIHNAEDGLMADSGGSESLETIIALSHNVGAAEVGLRIGAHAMYKTMRAFGFGDPTEVDLPGENPGDPARRSIVERDLAADDVVRPRHRDHADRADTRVRGDRQRRRARCGRASSREIVAPDGQRRLSLWAARSSAA